MTYRGKVAKNGMIVLDSPSALAAGEKVSVRVLKGRRAGGKGKQLKTVYERYKRCIGTVKDLPSDFSINHDHYLYGTPKRK